MSVNEIIKLAVSVLVFQ